MWKRAHNSWLLTGRGLMSATQIVIKGGMIMMTWQMWNMQVGILLWVGRLTDLASRIRWSSRSLSSFSLMSGGKRMGKGRFWALLLLLKTWLFNFTAKKSYKRICSVFSSPKTTVNSALVDTISRLFSIWKGKLSGLTCKNRRRNGKWS